MKRNLHNIKDWVVAGWSVLCIRFVAGWIFWGGASRRFIYAPEKLDPHSSAWMANKLQAAAPGSLLGTRYFIDQLLLHPTLLWYAIVMFSLMELFCGLGLLFGFFSRLSGIVCVLLSINLMVIFGWQGSTCLDEWTMAVSSLAMGFTIALTGSPVYSMDNWLMRKYPHLAKKLWFKLFNSGAWALQDLKFLAIIYLAFTILFTLTTYNYYRGAIFSKYHPGPVSAVVYHIALSNAFLSANGDLSFTLSVDAGSPAEPSYIVRISVTDDNKREVAIWDVSALSQLTADAITNTYPYNRITVTPNGLMAPVSAVAKIRLSTLNLPTKGHNYHLNVALVTGQQFTIPIRQ